jgi:hypothetical protein
MAQVIATREVLVEALRARGLVTGEPVAAAPGRDGDRPWYIGLLLGTAGWFAGIFALVFVFLLFRPTSGEAAFVFGPVLLGAAWAMFRVDRDGAFASQLALALSVGGQFAVLFCVHALFFKERTSIASVAFTALVLQAALVLAMPSRLHRTMSTFFACIAWAVFVRYGLWDHPGWGGYNKAPVEPPSLALALAAWAIVWVPVGALLFALVRREPAWMAASRQALVRPVITGLIAGLAAATLVSHPFDSFMWWSAAHAREGWLALWPMLSAFAALGALVAAHAIGSRGLIGVCVVAALAHASHFYYAMGTSLLVKAITMLVLGAVLLGAAHHLRKGRAP